MISERSYLCLFVFTVILFISCQGTLNSNEENPVIGTWIFDSYVDDMTVLVKSGSLDQNQYGISFYPSGSLVERKNAGWCGTPPITYMNFEGHWQKLSANLYHIEVGYWGGRTNYHMEIISIQHNRMRIRYMYSE